jgi:cysteine desulfurase family protein
MPEKRSLITFISPHHLLSAEEILIREGYRIKIVGVPREAISSCTKAIELDPQNEKKIKTLLNEKRIAIEGFHFVERDRSPLDRFPEHTNSPIYLNNAATSHPKPPAVYEEIERCLKNTGSSPKRSGNLQSDKIIYQTRKHISQLFNIDNPARIIFTFNATDGLNLALRGLLKPGDHVITTSLEHNSVIRPLRYLETQGVSVTKIKTSPEGYLNPEDIAKAIKLNTKLIAMTHASNVIGTILPVEEAGRIAKKRDILFLVDAAQTAGSYPVDVVCSNIDLLAFTGHKGLLGPQGTGGLYIREGINLCPLRFGGTGSQSELDAQPDILPDKYESGTLNLPGIAGLGKAIKFILEKGSDKIREHEMRLTSKLLCGLEAIKDVTVYGPKDASKQVATISINIKDYSPTETGTCLEEKFGIITRTGLHCSSWAHQTIGTSPQGTVRISLGYFNTEEEIDYTIKSIKAICTGSKNLSEAKNQREHEPPKFPS